MIPLLSPQLAAAHGSTGVKVARGFVQNLIKERRQKVRERGGRAPLWCQSRRWNNNGEIVMQMGEMLMEENFVLRQLKVAQRLPLLGLLQNRKLDLLIEKGFWF